MTADEDPGSFTTTLLLLELLLVEEGYVGMVYLPSQAWLIREWTPLLLLMPHCF